MKIAVIGSGISGLAAAWLLKQKHEVTLFEAGDYPGGHTNTVDVTLQGITHPVDTGFLVHNDLTYPNLIRLFEHLGVATYESDMSFSVSLPQLDIEWAGSNLATVFAQQKNLLRLRFWLMLRDILRFNQRAHSLLQWSARNNATLGELLNEYGYSHPFREWYLLPMAAAIWSSSPRDILDFPAETFLGFCINHRLLQIEDRPQWRSISGGGREYVRKMTAQLDMRLRCPVHRVERSDSGVRIHNDQGHEIYDAVVFGTHAPDTLHMLSDAIDAERNVLSAVDYQPNLAILHTDRRLLPKREAVWSAWNYMATGDEEQPVCVTYLLNRLQRLPFTTPVMVTLNPPAGYLPEDEIARFHYDHPVLDQKAIDAQHKLGRIQGLNKAWFCGAWTGYGFHEDGLKSALRIMGDFDVEAPWEVTL
ncbi:MAG: FAD-dependent oxidoreductase [Gammaproteobacteria bacterium]|nr:FAD-dependent oxidoreductase [Gammaproteobacteria bacterium]